MITFLLWWLVGFNVLSMVYRVVNLGKGIKPSTPGVIAVVAVIHAAIAACAGYALLEM